MRIRPLFVCVYMYVYAEQGGGSTSLSVFVRLLGLISSFALECILSKIDYQFLCVSSLSLAFSVVNIWVASHSFDVFAVYVRMLWVRECMSMLVSYRLQQFHDRPQCSTCVLPCYQAHDINWRYHFVLSDLWSHFSHFSWWTG